MVMQPVYVHLGDTRALTLVDRCCVSLHLYVSVQQSRMSRHDHRNVERLPVWYSINRFAAAM